MLAVEPSPRTPPAWAVSGAKVTSLRVPSAEVHARLATGCGVGAVASARPSARVLVEVQVAPARRSAGRSGQGHAGSVRVRTVAACFGRRRIRRGHRRVGAPPTASSHVDEARSLGRDGLATAVGADGWVRALRIASKGDDFLGVSAEATGGAEFHAAFAACGPVAWSLRDEFIHAQQDLGRVDQRIGRDDCLLVRCEALGGGCVPASDERGRECRDKKDEGPCGNRWSGGDPWRPHRERPVPHDEWGWDARRWGPSRPRQASAPSPTFQAHGLRRHRRCGQSPQSRCPRSESPMATLPEGKYSLQRASTRRLVASSA